MNKFLKSIILLSVIFLISFAGDCGGDPPPPPPVCNWSEKTDIILNEISLYYPANAPIEFRTIFPDNPIKDLQSILLHEGAIQVILFGTACSGSAKINYYYEDMTKVGISAIYDIPDLKDDIISSARISIRSKEYYDNSMNLVFVYWNETVDPGDYNSTDHVISNGSIVPASTVDFKNFREPIYIDGKIKDQV